MKLRTTAIGASAALILGLLAGCDNDANPSVSDSELAQDTQSAYQNAKDATLDAAQDLKEASSEAWNAFTGYTVDKKGDAVSFLERQSDKVDAQIEDLKEDAAEATADTKESLREAIATLESKREGLDEQIEELKDASAETWNEVKGETKETWNDLVAYLREVRNDIRDS